MGKTKIAIMGGSFDPVHKGHVKCARDVLEHADVDRVLMMPCYSHAFGKRMTPFEHRMEMVRLAVEETGDPRIEASDHERTVNAGTSIETALSFIERNKPRQLSWIIGTDQLPTLNRWKNVERLLELAQMIILPREGYPLLYLPKNSIYLEKSKTPNISSSEIRRMLENADENTEARQHVPRKVFDYIMKNGIYRR